MYGVALVLLTGVLPFGTPFLPLAGLALRWRTGPASVGWRAYRPALVLAAGLLCLLAFGATPKGGLQLVLCVVALVTFMELGAAAAFLERAWTVPFIMSAAALLLGPLALMADKVPEWGKALFVLGDHGGVRLRFVFSEPNHYAFAFYYSVLQLAPQLEQRGPAVRLICLLGVMIGALATGSPLAYLGLALLGVQLLLRRPALEKGALVMLLSIAGTWLTVFPPENVAERIDLLASGEDNSLNLRTWGALAIAQVTLAEAGREYVGVGIGAGRQVLEDNPYMALFAAQAESTLPSMAAGTLLEGGYWALACVLGLLLIGIARGRHDTTRWFSGIFLLFHALSGSFFYDTMLWTAMGLQLSRPLSRQPAPSDATQPAARAP